MPNSLSSCLRRLSLVVGVLLSVVVPGTLGCHSDETGILAIVFVAPEDEATLDGNLDALVFYVAVAGDATGPAWVLNRSATGLEATVTGMSLAIDPYRLLVREDGDELMETVKIFVVGRLGDQAVAWGTLENPEEQTFIRGRVVSRHIALHDAAIDPPPFVISAVGCVLDAEAGSVLAALPDDMDCDGAPSDVDCDDLDPEVGPAVVEICANGKDDNCDGHIDEVVDADGDGFTNCEPRDCDDHDPDRYPGAPELCDGLDNDCDGICDAAFDRDGDGYTDCGDGTGGQRDAAGACLGPPSAADWDCNDASGAVHPGATEICDGENNDCAGGVDDQPPAPCYEGPVGTEGMGLCRGGERPCLDGDEGLCQGQVLPSAEACNGMDDDCDGQTDEGAPQLMCGLGACRVSQPSCIGGVPQRCSPGLPHTEICNGLDDDCDGVVDEDCGCIHVAPFGDNSATGGPNDPLASIQAAITRAATNPVGPQQVCVAAGMGCPWTFYTEQVVMADGVQVLGGYDPATWAPSRTCVTEIRSPAAPAVFFGAVVVQPTALDGFVLSLNVSNTPVQSAVVYVEGSVGAVLGSCQVYGAQAGDITVGIEVTDDPVTGTPAAPLVHHTLVEGGDGASLSVGIHSLRSRPQVVSICAPADLDSSGRCLAGCGNTGLHIRGYRTGWSPTSIGVLLEDSPGVLIDQAMVCTRAGDDAAGVAVVGDAAGTVIRRSTVGAWGAANQSAGITLQDCDGAAPWISDNASIWSEGGIAGMATSVGVATVGDCHPLLEGNLLIAGGMEAGSAMTFGVYCGRTTPTGPASRCHLERNVEIRGSTAGVPTMSVGVLCDEGACGVVRGNARIHGRGGQEVTGLDLRGPSQAMVDANLIEGGCGTISAVGLRATDAAGRIQNNVLRGGTCLSGSTMSGLFVGVAVFLAEGVHELDLHSNFIDGAGTTNVTCTSIGVLYSRFAGAARARGILRNNVIAHGQCGLGCVFQEDDTGADPRVLMHNDLVPAANGTVPLYLDEAATPLALATQVDALTDCQVAGTLDEAPGWTVGGNGFPSLMSASPLRNAGTPQGAPGWDWEGDARPQESLPDIGPDELVP